MTKPKHIPNTHVSTLQHCTGTQPPTPDSNPTTVHNTARYLQSTPATKTAILKAKGGGERDRFIYETCPNNHQTSILLAKGGRGGGGEAIQTGICKTNKTKHTLTSVYCNRYVTTNSSFQPTPAHNITRHLRNRWLVHCSRGES